MLKLIFAIILLSANLAAQNQIIDNLQSIYIMPAGPFEGKVLNTSKIKNLVVLGDTNTSDFLYVANFSHNGTFYVAKINPKAAVKLALIYERFTDIPGGHANVVYFFNQQEPVELIYEMRYQGSDYKLIQLKKPIYLNEVLLTAEAVRAQGDNTPLLEGGLNSGFALGYRLTSVPERLIPTVVYEGRITSLIELPYDNDTAKRSLVSSLKQYSRISMSRNYNLLTNSCVTAALEAVYLGLNETEQKLVEKEYQRLQVNLNLLATNELSDTEIYQLITEYKSLVLNISKDLPISDLKEHDFFTKWLSSAEEEMLYKLKVVPTH